ESPVDRYHLYIVIDAIKQSSVRLDSGGGNIECLLALRPLCNFESDLLTFFECLEAVHLNRRKVCEKVFAPIIGGNKSETLSIIEPFYGSGQLLRIPGRGGCG